jgi:predicted ATP-grasp superfamily ATP-dependent carboligase
MQGLQLARILEERGVDVIGLTSNRAYYTTPTRACREVYLTDTGSEGLVDYLIDLAGRFQQKPVLFPCQDSNVLIVSRHREALEKWYRILLPDARMVEMLADKAEFHPFAREQGFRVPETFVLLERADAEVAATEMVFPCVLKPFRGVSTWTMNTNEKAFRANSPEELLALYDRCSGWAPVLVAQRWVQGTDADLISVNATYSRDGRPLATFVARKIRQWPPGTGKSSSGEEVRNDAALADALRLFDHVGLRGLGYVEFKQDARTSELFIIEPNIGRPTGRSAIAEAGGVELHFTAYCEAAGLPLPEARTQVYTGAKWINLLRDTQSAWYYWRRGELSLADWVRSVRGRKSFAIWALRDPAPFAAAVLSAARGAVAKRSLRRDAAQAPHQQVQQS